LATRNEINEILKLTLTTEKIKEGISVVILGEPNAGKSTLLNALSKKDAAIVSPEAGTTRDIIEVNLDIGGYPVTLIDTAGIRNTDNAIELEGIRRAKDRAQSADLKLLLVDASKNEPSAILSLEDQNSIVVRTKIDLNPNKGEDKSDSRIELTVKDEKTIDKLLDAIKKWVSENYRFESQPLYIRERHREHLKKAYSELSLYGDENVLELQCERLRLATTEIGKITGMVNVEELLDVIFSSFCIGK
jgi:tRNA modification GTPase